MHIIKNIYIMNKYTEIYKRYMQKYVYKNIQIFL